jgi:hypothetical protein
MNFSFKPMNFSSQEGTVAYGTGTGLPGVVIGLSITATNTNGEVTDFEAYPIDLGLYLPNSNPLSFPLKMYKVYPNTTNTFTKIDPQPTGFPVTLVYDGDDDDDEPYWWACQLKSLSHFVIIDESPDAAAAGGDPHIKSVLGHELITLPNEWKLIKLYESKDILVVAETKFVNDDIVSNMHHMDGRKIDVEKDRYVLDYTYFINVKIYKNNTVCLIINTVNGEIEYDNETIVHDKNNSVGIYSFLHKKHYDNKNVCNYMIYLNDSNRLEVTVDNYWLDLNSFNLYINDMNNVNECKGELVCHDINNCLE